MRTYALLTLLAIALLPPPALAVEEPSRAVKTASALRGGPRVRASDPRILAAIAEGTARSATFRTVLQQVERHDVIAYLAMQPQLRHRLSGSLVWVVATEEFRYVRVSLNPELSSSQLVAAVAHELQHVSEVGQAPSIVDSNSLSAFYRGVGVASRLSAEQWETEAARRTGETVRREMSEEPARVAESIQPATRTLPAFAQSR